MSVEIRVVSVDEYPSVVPVLAELLIQTVGEGASLGFLPPVDRDEAEWYWTSLRPDLVTGSRLLVGAFRDGRIVGSGQLSLPSWPNAKHRAELQKLFVAASLRGLRVGRSLVAGLHDAARRRGRSLVLLHARRPVADGFYKPLGYREVGVIPGYSTGSAGERIDTWRSMLSSPKTRKTKPNAD
jgi:GNAT superfamily N-acetyltransferase